MTMDELKALPKGTLLRLDHGLPIGYHEIGEIIETSPRQVTVIWPDSGVKQYIGLENDVWATFVCYLEVEE